MKKLVSKVVETTRCTIGEAEISLHEKWEFCHLLALFIQLYRALTAITIRIWPCWPYWSALRTICGRRTRAAKRRSKISRTRRRISASAVTTKVNRCWAKWCAANVFALGNRGRDYQQQNYQTRNRAPRTNGDARGPADARKNQYPQNAGTDGGRRAGGHGASRGVRDGRNQHDGPPRASQRKDRDDSSPNEADSAFYDRDNHKEEANDDNVWVWRFHSSMQRYELL